MDINLTFCVQVINFIIFYYGVSRFFLKPFVAFIQAKVRSRENVLEEFAVKEAHLKTLVHARTDLAQQFKDMLRVRHALPAAVVVSELRDDHVPEALSVQEQEAMTTLLTKKVVARIKNAY
jgi:hypothetical protein